MAEESKQQANVRSFRITDDVMSRFKEIQEAAHMTQDSALKMLVEVYELENAKNAIPERGTEIANFQLKANELVEAFLYSLQLNQDAEARARAEVSEQLKSKDRTILDLQKELDALKENTEHIRHAHEQLKETAASASTALRDAGNEIQKLRETLKDKQTIIDTLTGEKFKLELSIAKCANAEIALAKEKEKVDDLQAKVSELSEKLSIANKELETTTATYKAEIKDLGSAHINAIKAAENDKRQAVLDAKEEACKSIDEYIKKYEVKLAENADLQDELRHYKTKCDEYEKAIQACKTTPNSEDIADTKE